MQPERDLDTLSAQLPPPGLHRSLNPRLKRRLNGFLNQVRTATAPVFPGKSAVPIAPLYVAGFDNIELVHQSQIGHLDHPRGTRLHMRRAKAITKGVELLDIAQ